MVLVDLYNEIFPINPEKYDGTICRDEFLKRMFADLNLPDIQFRPRFDQNINIQQDNRDSIESLRSRASLLSRNSVLTQRSKQLASPVDSLQSQLSAVSTFSLLKLTMKDDNHFRLSRIVRYTTRSKFLRTLHRQKAHSLTMTQQSPSLHKLKSWRFKPGKPEDNFQHFYECIKYSAVHHTFWDAFRRLQLLFEYSGVIKDLDVSLVPNNLFSWSLQHFFVRRNMENCVYIDVFLLKYDTEQLNQLKLQTDIRELTVFYKFLYQGIFQTRKWHIKAMKVLREAKNFLNTVETLAQNLAYQHETLRFVDSKVSEVTWSFYDSIKRRLSQNLQMDADNAEVLLPIEFRYQSAHYRYHAEAVIMKQAQKIAAIEKEIKHYRDLIETSKYCTQVSLNSYYTQCNDLKQLTDGWTKKYDTDLDDVEDNIVRSRIRLDKAQDTLTDLHESIAMFRRRVIEVKQQFENECIVDMQRTEEKARNVFQKNKHKAVRKLKRVKKRVK